MQDWVFRLGIDLDLAFQNWKIEIFQTFYNTQNFKTLSKEQLKRAHGLNLDTGKGIKTESYRINSSPIQET